MLFWVDWVSIPFLSRLREDCVDFHEVVLVCLILGFPFNGELS